MKYIKVIFLGLIFLSFLYSCSNSKGKKQIYPEFDFKNTVKIEVSKYDSDFEKAITEKDQIEKYISFFKDSTNYFKLELINPKGTKPYYFINFISKKENLELVFYKDLETNKIEVGFFEPFKSQNQHRKYNRFYIKFNIIDLLKS